MKLQSINPYNNQVIKEYKEYSEGQINKLLKLSLKAYEAWRKTGFKVRSEKMHKLAALLKSEKEELGRTITLEMGKPVKQSIAEVEKCSWVCEYYAENAQAFLKEEFIQTEAYQSYVRYDPLGPILAIMPWNFPFWQVFRFAAPAVMAGNVGVLKHASNVQGCAKHIGQLFVVIEEENLSYNEEFLYFQPWPWHHMEYEIE